MVEKTSPYGASIPTEEGLRIGLGYSSAAKAFEREIQRERTL